MLKKLLLVGYFCMLAGIGILVGCFIHGKRTNQDTLMSGVAFVRELPRGEYIVGQIETFVFSRQERASLEDYKKQHEGKIQIDPEVLKKHKNLYK